MFSSKKAQYRYKVLGPFANDDAKNNVKVKLHLMIESYDLFKYIGFNAIKMPSVIGNQVRED